MLFDNSPETHDPPSSHLSLSLIADNSNPGLAAPFNKALDLAEGSGSPWLLLLDQDTRLTPNFLSELLEAAAVAPDVVAAIVPKLMEGRCVYSPTRLPRLGPRPLDLGFQGISEQALIAFNSAASVRVSAMRGIGGFPVEYWLDYLDYAVFHLLQRAGGRMQVLSTVLSHELSIADLEKRGSRERYENYLSAERRYYRTYGTVAQRILARFRLLKQALYLLLREKNGSYARMCVRSAVRFRDVS